jgi:Cdc6-like AAA superfamily ATPase
METMGEWFGLKEDRKDFFIENDAHASVFFARKQLESNLETILRKAFRTGNPPKFVLYGDWGIGKTHTLRHVEYVVTSRKDEGYRAQIVFVEMPDVRAKDDFHVAHAAFLDALGQMKVKNWILQYQAKYQSQAMDKIQRLTQSEDIAKAFISLVAFGEATRICWDWLRGISLSSTEARTAGLPPSLDQSNQMVNVLRTLGALSQDIDGSILILMLDEAAKLNSVSNADAVAHWLNAFKILADKQTKEVGLIVSASFQDVDSMPAPLQDMQVRSRFGESHYIELHNFEREESDDFVRHLLHNWIDSKKRTALISKYGVEGNGEEISDTSFPFTEKAFFRFIDYVVRNGGIANPRDIQHNLDDILNRAIDDERHILSSKYLEKVLAAA